MDILEAAVNEAAGRYYDLIRAIHFGKCLSTTERGGDVVFCFSVSILGCLYCCDS